MDNKPQFIKSNHSVLTLLVFYEDVQCSILKKPKQFFYLYIYIIVFIVCLFSYYISVSKSLNIPQGEKSNVKSGADEPLECYESVCDVKYHSKEQKVEKVSLSIERICQNDPSTHTFNDEQAKQTLHDTLVPLCPSQSSRL